MLKGSHERRDGGFAAACELDRAKHGPGVAGRDRRGNDAKGRILLVGTTDMDLLEPVIWNMTAIAASKSPGLSRCFGMSYWRLRRSPVLFRQ